MNVETMLQSEVQLSAMQTDYNAVKKAIGEKTRAGTATAEDFAAFIIARVFLNLREETDDETINEMVASKLRKAFTKASNKNKLENGYKPDHATRATLISLARKGNHFSSEMGMRGMVVSLIAGGVHNYMFSRESYN